jgi:hypothetical protein
MSTISYQFRFVLCNANEKALWVYHFRDVTKMMGIKKEATAVASLEIN